ncbi:unnamed protein product [Ascophyllum nodosum]
MRLWPQSPRDIKTEDSEIERVQYAGFARTSIQQAVSIHLQIAGTKTS